MLLDNPLKGPLETNSSLPAMVCLIDNQCCKGHKGVLEAGPNYQNWLFLALKHCSLGESLPLDIPRHGFTAEMGKHHISKTETLIPNKVPTVCHIFQSLVCIGTDSHTINMGGSSIKWHLFWFKVSDHHGALYQIDLILYKVDTTVDLSTHTKLG